MVQPVYGHLFTHDFLTNLRGNNCMTEQMSGVVIQQVNKCPPPAKITGEQMSGIQYNHTRYSQLGV